MYLIFWVKYHETVKSRFPCPIKNVIDKMETRRIRGRRRGGILFKFAHKIVWKGSSLVSGVKQGIKMGDFFYATKKPVLQLK